MARHEMSMMPKMDWGRQVNLNLSVGWHEHELQLTVMMSMRMRRSFRGGGDQDKDQAQPQVALAKMVETFGLMETMLVVDNAKVNTLRSRRNFTRKGSGTSSTTSSISATTIMIQLETTQKEPI